MSGLLRATKPKLVTRRKALYLIAAPAILKSPLGWAASSTPVNSTVNVAAGTGGPLFDVTADFANFSTGTTIWDGPAQYKAFYNNANVLNSNNGGYAQTGSGAGRCFTTASLPNGSPSACVAPSIWMQNVVPVTLHGNAGGINTGNCLQTYFPTGYTLNATKPAGSGDSPGVCSTNWAGANNTLADVINLSFYFQLAPGFTLLPCAGSKMGCQLQYLDNTKNPVERGGILATYQTNSAATQFGFTYGWFTTFNGGNFGNVVYGFSGPNQNLAIGAWHNMRIQIARGATGSGTGVPGATTGYFKAWENGTLVPGLPKATADLNGANYTIPQNSSPVVALADNWLGGGECAAAQRDSYLLYDNVRVWTGTGP